MLALVNKAGVVTQAVAGSLRGLGTMREDPSNRLPLLAMALYGIHADQMPLEFLRGAPRVYSVRASEREPKTDASRQT